MNFEQLLEKYKLHKKSHVTPGEKFAIKQMAEILAPEFKEKELYKVWTFHHGKAWEIRMAELAELKNTLKQMIKLAEKKL